MSGVQHIEIKASDADMRLDRWFAAKYPGLSFGRLQKLLRKGDIRVNGKRAKAADRIAVGDVVRVPPLSKERQAPTPRAERELTAEDRDYVRSMVMHEDKALFVLNKPAGLAVQGGSGTHRHLDGLLPGLVGRGGERPKLVHRLDRDTAGICVIAKTDQSARALTQAFRARDAKKTYWALTVGVPPMEEGEIEAALAKRGTAGNEKMEVVDRRDKDAKRALTLFEVVDRAALKAAWVALRPITGRTHQLRIHLAHMGTPIQGDGKYAGGERLEGVDKNMHLFARSLDIAHPMGGRLNAVAPLPDHMAKSWRLFGFVEHEGDNAFAAVDAEK
ncbi:MAG: RluA family pseudouridine synthase [Alphaproteobacteria bacterium]